MSSTFNVYIKEEKQKRSSIIRIKDGACFSYLGCPTGYFHWNERSYPAKNITSIKYFPELSTRTTLTEKECVLAFGEMKEALPELPWGKGDFAKWAKNGMSISTDVPGQAMVGLCVLIRYVNEYPETIQEYLTIRQQLKVNPVEAIFLAHNIHQPFGSNGLWRCDMGRAGHHGHSMFYGRSLNDHCYSHFVNKVWAKQLKELKPYKETTNYMGINKLFIDVEYPGELPQWFGAGLVEPDRILEKVNQWRKAA